MFPQIHLLLPWFLVQYITLYSDLPLPTCSLMSSNTVVLSFACTIKARILRVPVPAPRLRHQNIIDNKIQAEVEGCFWFCLLLT